MKKKTFIIILLLVAITTLLMCSCKTTKTVQQHPSQHVIASTDYTARILIVKTLNGTVLFTDTIEGEPVYINKINSEKPFDVDTYVIYWCKDSKNLCTYSYGFDEFICLEPMRYDGKCPNPTAVSRQ